jgi:hypothetical protein
MPWSRHGGVLVSATEFASWAAGALVNQRRRFWAPGNTEIAEADMAEATNFLREYFRLAFMGILSTQICCSPAHIITHPAGRWLAVLLLPVLGVQYFFPTKFRWHGGLLFSSISAADVPPASQSVGNDEH